MENKGLHDDDVTDTPLEDNRKYSGERIFALTLGQRSNTFVRDEAPKETPLTNFSPTMESDNGASIKGFKNNDWSDDTHEYLKDEVETSERPNEGEIYQSGNSTFDRFEVSQHNNSINESINQTANTIDESNNSNSENDFINQDEEVNETLASKEPEDGGLNCDDNTKDESKLSIENEMTNQTIDTTKETIIIEQSYSDGYYDQSIDKIYERYNKSKLIEEEEESKNSSDDLPTGCFDDTKETQNGINQMSFFKRCTQKKYIVLSSTAMCMLLAAATAVILTVNVFHVTGRHHHGQYHGDVGKTAENTAELYQHASVSSDSGNCSRIAVNILRQNGSAVDAAIACAFCLGVTNRQSSGIGGGGYMLIYNRANRSFNAYDFRETAPGRIQSNVYDKDVNASRYGGMAIGVPGEVKGLYKAWEDHGKLPWKQLVQPAIDLAKYGVAVIPSVHNIINRMISPIQADPGLSKLLLNSNGEALEIGANMIDEELAATLTTISENPMSFYDGGKLTEQIVTDVTEAGGIISFDDLANYRVINREVIHDTIDDLDLHTIGAPTGGPVVISLLNILKGYKLKREDIESKKEAPLTYHRIAEAMKFAFAIKTREGDPTFNTEYMHELVGNMTNEEFGPVLRRKINDSLSRNMEYYEPKYRLPNESGTSQISIVAENGDAVSLTTTINEWYGSLNRSMKTGIIYNNEMNDFSIQQQQPTNNNNVNNNDTNTSSTLPPSPMNGVHSGKRPVSSTSPIIMTDVQGDVRFVLGGVGGMRIIPSVTQVIINKLWFKDDLGTAMSRPRIYNFLQPDMTYVEQGLEDIVPSLIKRNHSVEIVNPEEYTAVQAIYIEQKNKLYAKSDRRKSGHSAGY